ncbi:hypothetical protein MRB53_009510 [Persea americana]|uniref:Uncharacterized protein n=1 Tax=Persea americana TaxID=3435 RepID=A0ACC2LPB2_PERAE|nr:hypothetical protein MRB53_009510 [Persea americana]
MIQEKIGTTETMTGGRSRDRDYDVESKHEQDWLGDREREYDDIEPEHDGEWYGHPEPENKIESYDHYECHRHGQLDPNDEQERYEGMEPDDCQDRFDRDDSRPQVREKSRDRKLEY